MKGSSGAFQTKKVMSAMREWPARRGRTSASTDLRHLQIRDTTAAPNDRQLAGSVENLVYVELLTTCVGQVPSTKNAFMKNTRPAKTRLVELVSSVEEPMDARIPLVHTTDAYRFDEVLGTGVLVPTLCDVFEEKLLYIFLGRPAYRTRQQNNDRLHFDLPIVVILNPDGISVEPVRIFPFDTGAFESGMYKRYFHKDTEVMDFSLGSDRGNASKFISIMYQNFREYFIGETAKNVDIPYGSYEAEGLHELARAPADPSADGKAPPDERSSSVEFQFDSNIPLVGNTLAVIMPQQYLDRDNILQSVHALSPKYVETYEVISKSGAREIAGSIYEITRQIYRKEGLIP